MNDIPTSPEKIIDLKSLSLEPLSDELEEYNRRFNAGAIAGRKLISMFNIEDQEETVSEGTEQESQLAFQQRIQNKFGETLARTGTNLEPVNGPMTLMTAEGNTPSSLLRINLADRKQFLAYLAALDSKEITDSQTKGLIEVGKSLISQLYAEYEIDRADNRTIELFGSLDNIIQQYKRLDPVGERGLFKSLENLIPFAEAAKGKYLREYVLIQRSNLLLEIGGNNFGPSRWHIDTTEERYEQYWNNALDVLSTVGKNPNTTELFNKLRDHLIASIEYAKQDLESGKYGHNVRVQNKLDILEDNFGILKKA